MAQEQTVNNQGIGEIVLWLTGGTSTTPESISAIKTACSAATASGYSDYTQCTEAGLTLATIGTISASSDSFSNDTVHIEHPFTAGTDATVKGHMIANDDDDALYSVCCYAGDITVESGDTITVTHKIRLKNG
jgi:hypothetical protein